MKKTPLKRTKRINPISDKRKAEMKDELKIREQLCGRAGGLFVTDGVRFRCIGGLCERCHKPPDFRDLRPHEKIFKSHGGKLSLENSEMLCGKCHSEQHGIKEV